MDFDGDECNAIFPYTPLGMREVKELMFVEYHMASLASSSLIVGYHQDVNLSAHMMTMQGNFVPVAVWNEMARVSYDTRWKEKYGDSDEGFELWLDQFQDRIEEVGIEMYSGHGLYSTLLPEDMEWSLGGAQITRGILTRGLLEAKTTSGTSSSIGMVMYRTYGSKETLSWLNGSYRMLNLYLIQRGITLGFPHLLLTNDQQTKINAIKDSVARRKDLRTNTEDILDPVLRARTEYEIAQELSNARETVSVEVMNPKDIDLTLDIKGKIVGNIVLYRRNYSILPNCDAGDICISNDPMLDIPNDAVVAPISMEVFDQFLGNTTREQDERSATAISIVEKISIPVYDIGKIVESGEEYGQLNNISLDLYSGSITWVASDRTYVWSMGLFPRVEITLVSKEIRGDSILYTYTNIDRSYVTPNPLRIMIESGARGNATNAIQIAGIIGQQSFGGGRIPRMLETSQTPLVASLDSESVDFKNATGPRSMPCYAFGENTPTSRGFISNSYIHGMTPDEYMSAHVASRENLTSNTDLTPRTGYFERRVRTFTENLRITRIDGKTVVTNERGVIVMWDYLLDPSRVFSIDKETTFVDTPFEIRHMKSFSNGYRRDKVVYLYVPYRERMDAYLAIDQRIQQILSTQSIVGTDVVIACDPRIEFTHPDFYEYLHSMLPSIVQNNTRHTQGTAVSDIVVFSLSPSLSEAQRKGFFLSMTEYDTVIVIPTTGRYIDVKVVSNVVDNVSTLLPRGGSAALNVSAPSIYAVSHPAPRRKAIPLNILYSMLTYGADFERFPYIVKPSTQSYSLLEQHSLFEALLLSGDVYSV